MAERLLALMHHGEQIHFNLDGMLSNGETLNDIVQKGLLGAGEGNWTNWEFVVIVSNKTLFEKTTFYVDGEIFRGVEHFQL